MKLYKIEELIGVGVWIQTGLFNRIDDATKALNILGPYGRMTKIRKRYIK